MLTPRDNDGNFLSVRGSVTGCNIQNSSHMQSGVSNEQIHQCPFE